MRLNPRRAGHIVRRGTLPLTPTPVSAIPEIGPGPGWAGTANTIGAPTDASTILRTNSNYAKPGARVLTEPGGLVLDTTDLVIGIHAYAGNSLGRLPLVVYLWVNGAAGGTSTIIPFGSHSYTDANGNPRTIWGYFAKLKRGLFDQTGAFNVVWNVTCPADPSYENRTVGPFEYTAVSFTGHDFNLEVGPGKPYTTLGAALSYLAAAPQSAVNPCITITGSGNYELTGPVSNYKAAGYCTITHAPGVIAWIDNTAKGVCRYHGLRLKGSGIRVNLGQTALLGELGAIDGPGGAPTFYKPLILDGIILDNLLGLNNKQTMSGLAVIQTSGRGNGIVILDDTLCRNTIKGFKTKGINAAGDNSWLIRNARIENFGGGDGLDGVHTNIYGLTGFGQSISWFQDEAINLAGMIKYDPTVGPASSIANWRTTAETGRLENTLVLTTDAGAITIDLNTTNAVGGEKTITQLKADIEANPGWTFTLINDIKWAQWLAGSLDEAAASVGTPPHNCLNVEDEVYALAGYHGDMFQPYNSSPGPYENYIRVNVKLYGLTKMQADFALTGSQAGYNDCFIINNAFGGTIRANYPTTFSQWGGKTANDGPLRNVHKWYNMYTDQRFKMTNAANGGSPGFDAYCSVIGNVYRDWESTSNFALNKAGTISQNFIETRTSAVPGELSIQNAGSTIAALISDPVNGDFSPKPGGGLATIPSLVAFDIDNQARGAISHIGAKK